MELSKAKRGMVARLRGFKSLISQNKQPDIDIDNENLLRHFIELGLLVGDPIKISQNPLNKNGAHVIELAGLTLGIGSREASEILIEIER